MLLGYLGGKYLSDINGDLCRKYAATRTAAAARNELTDLRAAINYHRREGLCDAVVDVVLPKKGGARTRWLTRSEAAKLIWAAWRYREVQKGHATGRHSRRHVARFLVAALYTARRKTALLTASIGPMVGHPWFDLEQGVLHGRPGPQTKKRQPGIPIPVRLLSHLRRWQRNGQRFAIEFNGAGVASVDKAFAATVEGAQLEDVSPHTTRHTAITWLAIEGVDPYEICRFAGITMRVFEEVYAHFHPDYMSRVRKGFSRHRH